MKRMLNGNLKCLEIDESEEMMFTSSQFTGNPVKKYKVVCADENFKDLEGEVVFVKEHAGYDLRIDGETFFIVNVRHVEGVE